ncbi:MAG: hypothetical protein NZM42_04640 [Gemmatales bacterium]|nr:hypothetical protein [Gemmatales bacterium]MDW8222546.1 hypothetical protein [Gemmatales bacterium]
MAQFSIGYLIPRYVLPAVKRLPLWLLLLAALKGCGRNDNDVPPVPGSATQPPAPLRQDSGKVATQTNSPSNSSLDLEQDVTRILASIPDDVTPLREQLQRDWEVSFQWDERDDGKIFLAQLSFRKQLNDGHLVALVGLPGPLDVSLSRTGVSDLGLALLARLRVTQRQGQPLLADIWELHLGYTRVSDAGLPHLSAFASLRVIDLTKTDISDAGLVHLAKLTQLRRLILARTPIYGSGLAHLRELKSLIELDLDATYLNDDGLQQLPALPQLQKLNLRGTRITDAALARLKDLPALEELDVTNTRITDACVPYLKELKKLRRLRIADRTGLTERGAIQLRLALPEQVQID